MAFSDYTTNIYIVTAPEMVVVIQIVTMNLRCIFEMLTTLKTWYTYYVL